MGRGMMCRRHAFGGMVEECPENLPASRIRFSRILEKLQKSKIFYFSGEYWKNACPVYPVKFLSFIRVKCDACPVKFEVRKYFTGEGAISTGE